MVFNHVPDAWTLAGGALIVASGIYVVGFGPRTVASYPPMFASYKSRFAKLSDPVKAALLVVFAGFLFSTMNAMIRHAASELHPVGETLRPPAAPRSRLGLLLRSTCI